MKKPDKRGVTAAKIVAGIAATLTLGANVNGCVYGPAGLNQNVYGPPPSSDTTLESSETSEPSDTTGKTERTEKPEPSISETSMVTYNMNEDVYGPPEDFDFSANQNEVVYGPPEDMG